MTSVQKYALDTAKEITIAQVSSNNFPANSPNGEAAAEFFEQVYNKVLSLCLGTPDED